MPCTSHQFRRYLKIIKKKKGKHVSEEMKGALKRVKVQVNNLGDRTQTSGKHLPSHR